MRSNSWLNNCEKKETIFYPNTVPNQITTQEFVIRKSTGTERKMLININFL